VARYEEGCSSVCINLFTMLEGKDKASETRWDSTTFENTDVEMG